MIWPNVADLSPGSSNALSFEVKQTTSHFTIGARYGVEAGAYVAEQARYLPKFSAAGAPEGPSSTSFTGYASGSATTTITALQITQAEESPKAEILRGVHDHQVTYKLTVTNTSVNATGKVIVEDWLPADLEYLGCGGASTDHTTDAPTNPGSDEEYPGSGPIVVPALGGCITPSGVETLMTDPDGAEEDPDAVYTHVSWSLGTLAAGETRTFEFRAAVPLRENTTTWTAKEPTVASGEQATNLNNNSGNETTDGESIITFAKASGDYDETAPVSASGHLTRVAKDLTIEKCANTNTLAEGQVTQWTITRPLLRVPLQHGSHRDRHGAQRPVPPELEKPDQKQRMRTGRPRPLLPVRQRGRRSQRHVEARLERIRDQALAEVAENATTTITYDTKTRTHYQHEHKARRRSSPTTRVTNKVLAQATTNVVCENDTDCSGTGKRRSTTNGHSANTSPTARAPRRKPQARRSRRQSPKSATACLADEYTDSIPDLPPGRPQVCWRLSGHVPDHDRHQRPQRNRLPADRRHVRRRLRTSGEKGQARAPRRHAPRHDLQRLRSQLQRTGRSDRRGHCPKKATSTTKNSASNASTRRPPRSRAKPPPASSRAT